jgi:phosphate transport system substrate-binding protein
VPPLLAALLAGACAGGGGSGSPARTATGPINLAAAPGAADEAVLAGAGSTFVANLLATWTEQYRRAAPGVTIEYDPAGSPAGVRRLREGTVDFATSDLPLSDLEEIFLGGSDTLAQVPWAAGGIAVLYNLPDVPDLRLAPDTVAMIFTGRIVRWDDAAIGADNPGRRLPNLPISIVRRADPSASTSLFASYLKAAAPDSWGLGTGTEVSWPRGTGVRGSQAVAQAVGRTVGAVGYAQASYARGADLGVALLRNRAGRYVAPTAEAVQAALAAANARRFEATYDLYFETEAPGAYPLSTVSYLLYRRDLGDPAKERALRHLAEWALGEGQRSAEQLGYAPVPLAIALPALSAVQQRR